MWQALFPLFFATSSIIVPLFLQVQKTANITITGNPATLFVMPNSAGQASAQDSSTGYTISSNLSGNGSLKITGSITSGGNMPFSTSLSISLSSNQGISQGARILSTNVVNLVTNLPNFVVDSGIITYNFSLINGWTIPAQTLVRVVTLTLTSN